MCSGGSPCTGLISDLQTWFVPASWALCTFVFKDHNDQTWVVRRQSQRFDIGPERSSDGPDRHGNGVQAFGGSQTHEQGYLAASISSNSHWVEVHRNAKLLMGFSKAQWRTAASRVASPPAPGGPQELLCSTIPTARGGSRLLSQTFLIPETDSHGIWGLWQGSLKVLVHTPNYCKSALACPTVRSSSGKAAFPAASETREQKYSPLWCQPLWAG